MITYVRINSQENLKVIEIKLLEMKNKMFEMKISSCDQ